MSEIVGYARVSTVSQNLDAQIDALEQAGCTRIFTDKGSGITASAPDGMNCCPISVPVIYWSSQNWADDPFSYAFVGDHRGAKAREVE